MRLTEVGMVRVCSCSQLKSALAMAVMEVGISREVRALPWKRIGGRAVSEVGSTMLVSDEQKANAKEPTKVTLDGMEMVRSDEQPLKAALPTTRTELGMATATRERQFRKAAFSMAVELGGSVMADRPWHSAQREQGKKEEGWGLGGDDVGCEEVGLREGLTVDRTEGREVEGRKEGRKEGLREGFAEDGIRDGAGDGVEVGLRVGSKELGA